MFKMQFPKHYYFYNSRNNSDDVAVLRRELQNVQKLMMSEDQSFTSNLIDENENLRQELRQLKENASQLESKEIESLRQEIGQLKGNISKTESAELENLRQELRQLKENAQNEESAEMETVREKFRAEIDDLKSKLVTAELKLSESEEKLSKVKNINDDNNLINYLSSHVL